MDETAGLSETGLVVGVAAVVGAVVAFATGFPIPFTLTLTPPIGVESVVRIKLFVTTFNVVVLLVLLWNYVAIYRRLPNRFTLSLAVFTVALLLYAVSSNPLVPLLLGFRHGTALGPFAFLPDVFASIAAVILVYQSYA